MATDNEIRKELEELSPVVAGLPKAAPYSVPAGYFEQLPATMLARTREAKVVSMDRSRWVWRMAAAAVTAGIVITAWLVVDHPASQTASMEAVQSQMKQVSESEIAAYVEGNDLTAGDETFSWGQMKDEDVPLVLADVSDQELQQYLEDQNTSKLN